MHHDIACKRNGEVVTQAFLAKPGSKFEMIACRQFFIGNLTEIVAAVEHFEEQFVTLFAVLAHQCLQGLHRRSLYLLKTVEGIYRTDGIKDIVTLGHLFG